MPGIATLKIKDEVNLKIDGLELDARRALMQKFEFEVPGARYMPSVKLEDGTARLVIVALLVPHLLIY